MPRHHRIQLYWPGRAEPVAALGRELAALLAALAEVHPGLAGFHYRDAGGALQPVGSPQQGEAALAAGEVTWQTGDTPRKSYQQRLVIERWASPPVAIDLVTGIEPLGLGPIFTPNRLDLRIRTDVGAERAERPVLEAALRAAVRVLRPAFGFAGSENVPRAPVPVFSDGTPVVGWMTYLAAAFPPVPRTLPQPAVVYPVDALGTLVVAHPEAFREGDPAHAASLARVRDALREAGVLVPSTDLDVR